MVKRGQISIFIIIGVVLVLIFGFIFSTSRSLNDGEIEASSDLTSFEKQSIKNYVTSCLEVTLKKGLFEVGYSNNTKLQNYLNENTKNCTHSFSSLKEFNISEGSISSKIFPTTNNEFLVAEIKYPLSIKKGDSASSISDFNVKINLKSTTTLSIDDGIITTDTNLISSDRNAQLLIPSGTKITLPDGTVTNEASITIKDKYDPSTDVSYILGNLVYELSPEGVQFDPPVILSVEYDETDIPEDIDEDELVMSYFDGDIWRNIPSQIDKENNLLKAELSHFSKYSVVVPSKPVIIFSSNYDGLNETIFNGSREVYGRIYNSGPNAKACLEEIGVSDGKCLSDENYVLMGNSNDPNAWSYNNSIWRNIIAKNKFINREFMFYWWDIDSNLKSDGYFRNHTGDPSIKCGTIGSEVWSGNISVTCSVIVPSGVTLIIEPGTIIKFKHDRNYKTFDRAQLLVDGGDIIAKGTKDAQIWFTSDADIPINGDWQGISIYDSGKSEFDYVIVEYGENNIEQFDSSVSVRNSIVRWANSEGLYAERSKPIFENNLLYACAYHEIALEQYNNAIIRNNIFKDGHYAIHQEKTNTTIEGNCILNQWGGISAGMESNVYVNNNYFYNIGPDAKIGVYDGSTINDDYESTNVFDNVNYNCPKLDYKDLKMSDLKYIPGDPQDRFPYIFNTTDETRKIVKKIGEGLSFGWALEYADGYLYRFSLGSGEIGDSLDFIRINPSNGSYEKFGNDEIMNPRGLAWDGEFFYVNDFSLLKIFKFKVQDNYIKIFDSFDIPEKENGGTAGLTTDGNYLYLISRDGSKIYKLDKVGNLVDELPKMDARDIKWVDGYFWATGGCGKGICKFSPNGTLVDEIYPAAKDTWAITSDGRYLWTIQRTCEMWNDPKIYQIEVCKNGDCGYSCASNYDCGNSQICQDGNCVDEFKEECMFACRENEDCCNNGCWNLMLDEEHCGSCGNSCGIGQTCCGGECLNVAECTSETLGCPGQIVCNGICWNPMVDNGHCGSCGNSCGIGQTCCGGECLNVAECTPETLGCTGQIVCDGICWNPMLDEKHCGSCGNSCGIGQTCCGGECLNVAECTPETLGCTGQIVCDGVCVNSTVCP